MQSFSITHHHQRGNNSRSHATSTSHSNAWLFCISIKLIAVWFEAFPLEQTEEKITSSHIYPITVNYAPIFSLQYLYARKTCAKRSPVVSAAMKATPFRSECTRHRRDPADSQQRISVYWSVRTGKTSLILDAQPPLPHTTIAKCESFAQSLLQLGPSSRKATCNSGHVPRIAYNLTFIINSRCT